MVRDRSRGYTRGWAGLGGSTTRWRRLRLLILARDGWECQIKGPRCRGTADTVDHVVALADGGAMYDETNLRASCGSCNYGRRDPGPKAQTITIVERRTAW